MKFVVPFLAAAALAGSASAGFTGFSSSTSVQGDGKVVTQVFANFEASNDTLLNVFQIAYTGGVNTSGFGIGNFYHADFTNGLAYNTAVGSWSPTLSTPVPADSFLTIGGGPGFANSTSGDPSFGALFNSAGLVTGGGWFNSNPPNLQGAAGAGLKTLIGQFITDNGKTWQVFAKVGFNGGLGTPTTFGENTFTIGIPAPGAVALLGLAGLAGRRRRA